MVQMPNAASMPPLPMDEEGPVFKEPWEAAAFALVLNLYERGHFTWPEWVEYLGAEIRAGPGDGDADLGSTYYRHWLSALEKLVVEKRLAPAQDLAQRRAEIKATPPSGHDHEARRTPVKVG